MPDGPLHKNFTATNLHVPGYQQSSDPGAVGAGKYWIDTTGGTGAWALKVRNAGDSGWETVATAGTGLTAASQAQQEAGTDITVGTTPGRQQYHPSAFKAWVHLYWTTGTPTIRASYNVSSLTDNGTGDVTVNFTTAFSSAYYGIFSCGETDKGTNIYDISVDMDNPPTTSAARFYNTSEATQIATDTRFASIGFAGDQ